MAVSAALSALAAGVNTIVVKLDPSFILPLVFLANGFAALFGFALFFNKHRREKEVQKEFKKTCTPRFLWLTLIIGSTQLLSFYFILLAIAGDTLSIVYSINAHYILIPVVLSVWFYKEHWNRRKALALTLSLLALVLLHR
jgi:drug/metabolite transporter (DMT)-like permease